MHYLFFLITVYKRTHFPIYNAKRQRNVYAYSSDYRNMQILRKIRMKLNAAIESADELLLNLHEVIIVSHQHI